LYKLIKKDKAEKNQGKDNQERKGACPNSGQMKFHTKFPKIGFGADLASCIQQLLAAHH
jgi:hypothetical protein